MMRPMVVRFGALGDMVLMTVPIRYLYERFGEPVDILGSGAWTAPLLKGQPGVGCIYLIQSRSNPYWMASDQRQLVSTLRRRGPGPTWFFDARNAKTLWLLERAGWRVEHLHRLENLPDIPNEHFCDHWLRFAQVNPGPPLAPCESIGVHADATPRLTIREEVRNSVERWMAQMDLLRRPYILIQAGNKRTMHGGNPRRGSNTKYWPATRWGQVLRGLRALHPQHVILLLGIGQEADFNAEILLHAKVDDAIDLASQMSIDRLMVLCARAIAMLSVDTGSAHVAKALGCRLLVLFDSAEKAAMYRPRGPGLPAMTLVGAATDGPSLLSLSPEMVLKAWSDMMVAPEPAH